MPNFGCSPKYSFTLLAGAPQKLVCLCQRSHAEGNAPVQLVLGGTGAGGEHDAFEGEALLGRVVVEQRSGARGIEDGVGVLALASLVK
jgi:hypothetical protein